MKMKLQTELIGVLVLGCSMLGSGCGDNKVGANQKDTGTSVVNSIAIAAGWQHSCALLNGGTVECWGSNNWGQLGNSSTTDMLVPVDDINTATAIAAGSAHNCALLSGGTVECWGSNNYGELGNGSTADGSTPTPVLVSSITTATAVAAAEYHTCALLSGGTVECWGHNDTGQLGDGSTTDRTTPVLVGGITTAVAIAAGATHTCALLSDGSIECWGYSSGQLGNGSLTNGATPTPVSVSNVTSATAIAADASITAEVVGHTCALLSGGSVACWGNNAYGQVGNAAPSYSAAPVPVSNITTATAIAAGGMHTCALLSGGTVECWGRDSLCEIGDDSSIDSAQPVLVGNISAATAIAAGDHHTCVLLSSGAVECWGSNGFGQLGPESTTSTQCSPIEVSSP